MYMLLENHLNKLENLRKCYSTKKYGSLKICLFVLKSTQTIVLGGTGEKSFYLGLKIGSTNHESTVDIFQTILMK
jgi:hypothetical protein